MLLLRMSSQGFSLNDARVATAASRYLRQYVPLIGPASTDNLDTSPSWNVRSVGHRWKSRERTSIASTASMSNISHAS